MTTLSVLTPSYNYARFLPAAVASVPASTPHLRVEHVVSDGASTDGTVEYLESLGSRVTWMSSRDRGQSDALNRALQRSSSDYVAWLNSDDFYVPGGLEAAIEYLDAHPDCDVVHGDTILVDESGKSIRMLFGYPAPFYVLASRGCVISSPATVIRRSALAAEPWDIRLRYIMDWDLFLGLLRRKKKIVHLPILIGGMRIHEGQVSAERRDGDYRDSTEHEIVTMKYKLGPYRKPTARVAGDLVHKILKGCYMIKSGKRLTDVGGVQLLKADAEVDPTSLQKVLARAYRGYA